MADEELEIILRAVDDASSTFESVGQSAEEVGSQLQTAFEDATSEVDRLTEELAAIEMGDLEGDFDAVAAELAEAEAEAEALGNAIENLGGNGLDDVANSADNAGAGMSSAEGDAQGLANSIDNIETEANESKEALDGMADLMAFQEISGWVNQAADAMWQLADKAGRVQDSWTRVGLAAEGAGIPVDNMKKAIGDLSAETGRAGGSVRESFIAMSSAGVTELSAMESAFKGASAQSFILGTDVDTLVNKFSGMAMKSSVAERTLKGTGITVEELGNALGIQGATIEDVNAKWETMDTNARMAALGQASAMNEGKDANDAFKNSWEGLQAQIDKAKGRLEVLVGSVLLPVLVPALEAAARVLDWFGNMFSAVMDGPLGTFISIIGSVGAGLILLLGGITAVTAGMGFFTASLWPAITASWALLSPWLPFIAAAVVIVAAIYEIGKAFGWWKDASSMMDALWAGIQRLWSAFINHPDVQGAISAISGAFQWLSSVITAAWSALMDFLGVSTGGEFDVVHEIIMAIGAAWNMITAPIRAVIGLVTSLISIFSQLATGQIDLQTAIGLVWNALLTFFQTMTQSIFFVVIQFAANLLVAATQAGMNLLNGVITYVSRLPGRVYTYLLNVATRIVAMGARWVSIARQKANQMVIGIITYLMQLPGKVFSALMGVVGRITGAIGHWINAAKSKVREVINAITSPFRGVAGAISGALSGVTNAIKAPFEAAWNALEPLISKIQEGMKLIGAAGGEMAAGGESLDMNTNRNFNISTGEYTIDDSPIVIEDNINLSLDLSSVPRGVNTNELVTAIQDRNVLNALVTNRDFQDLDARVKQRINLKNVRARGR